MSRSVKKGPFVNEALMKRIVEMNNTGKKAVAKTWSRSSTIFPDFVGHTIAVHDGRSMCPSTSPRTWSATSWASSPPPARIAVTPAKRPPAKSKRKE